MRNACNAAIIVEPLGPESGTRPAHKEFNANLRKLCDEFGALLIFDEVVSGFRVGLSGAQDYFKVKPDLTIFGKCLTGGYPMAGGIGGFCLTAGLGAIKQSTGDYQLGLWLFASLGVLAWFGLHGVKLRWRTTWGSAAVTAARV